MSKNENEDELLAAIKNFPDDWWQNQGTSEAFSKLFKKLTLPLLLAGSVDGNIQYNVYSGFLLELDQNLVWISAGHVIEDIICNIRSPSFQVIKMAWMDSYDKENAEFVTLHRKNIPMKSWKSLGYDVGIIIPSLLDVGNLYKNENAIFINPIIWKNVDKARPEGFYAIGYPKTLWNHSTSQIQNKILHTINSQIICLPLKQIQPPSELKRNPGWSNPDSFFGELIPYVDNPEFQFEEAKGMSGGLILSVERDTDGQIRYRLFGIIQSFAESQYIFRAEPIQKLTKMIKDWMNENLSDLDL